jgi:hypothetical protein
MAPMSEYQFLGADIEKNRADLRLLQKKRYRGLIGIGIGAAGLAAGLAGMDLSVSIGIWVVGLAGWAWLKAV